MHRVQPREKTADEQTLRAQIAVPPLREGLPLSSVDVSVRPIYTR